MALRFRNFSRQCGMYDTATINVLRNKKHFYGDYKMVCFVFVIGLMIVLLQSKHVTDFIIIIIINIKDWTL